MNHATTLCNAFLLCAQHSLLLAAENACMPGDLRTDSTPNCISIEWDVRGDSNHNAACKVQYRKQGAGCAAA